jgi:hypothetical protein
VFTGEGAVVRYHKAEKLFYGVGDDFLPNWVGEVFPQDVDVEVAIAHMAVADGAEAILAA